MKKVTNTRIDPAKDLVDVWRLLRSSLILEKWDHPSLSRVHEEDMQAYLSRYMLNTPTFMGMIARVGKRPVAQIFGHGNFHPVGAPEHYFFIHNVWVEPDFRGGQVMPDLWAQFHASLKKSGYFFWEANGYEKLTRRLLKAKGTEIRKLYTRIGGAI